MRLDHLGRSLDRENTTPLALQVARALAQAIQGGDLRPGEALPGTRPLAESLGVSRYAVLGAIKELELEGFLVLRQGSGAYVSERPPCSLPGAWGGRLEPPTVSEGLVYDLSSQLLPISSLGSAEFDLSEGFPDPRLAPQAALAKAYQRAVKRHGDELFGVGEPKGNATLRHELVRFLREHRGLAFDPECILVTRGLRNGLDLAIGALFPTGGLLGAEVPRTTDLWDGIALHRGVRIAGIPGDAGGLETKSLDELLARETPRALLLRSACGGVEQVADQTRGEGLLVHAGRHRFAVLEDDSAFPFAEGALPPLPLAAEDRSGAVIYMMSFARLVAPGIRLGLLAGPRDLVDRLARVRRSSELQGDRVLEWAMADLLRDGDLDRFLRRASITYSERAQRFAEGLRSRLGAFLEVGKRDGLLRWVQGLEGFDLTRWAAECRQRGVKLRRPEDPQPFRGGRARIALGFGILDDREQVRVLDSLHQAAVCAGH